MYVYKMHVVQLVYCRRYKVNYRLHVIHNIVGTYDFSQINCFFHIQVCSATDIYIIGTNTILVCIHHRYTVYVKCKILAAIILLQSVIPAYIHRSYYYSDDMRYPIYDTVEVTWLQCRLLVQYCAIGIYGMWGHINARVYLYACIQNVVLLQINIVSDPSGCTVQIIRDNPT